MAKNNRIKRNSLEPVIFHTVNTLLMLIVVVVMLYPFWNTVAVSFNNAMDTLKGGITLWPRKFTLYNYQTVFKNPLLVTATINSVLRTVLATVTGVFVAALVGYVLSRPEFLWRKFATRYFLITMYVSAGLIPNYFLIKDLNLLNNFLVYILPGMVSAFNIIIIRSYMQSLPPSLSEAAFIDGAGHFRCFFQIILPCCKPVLATVALWCAVGAWNSWFDTFIYCSSDDSLTTLQYEMMKMLSSAMQAGSQRSQLSIYGQQSKTVVTNTMTPASMQAAVTVVAAVPILCVYPFLQKYFVNGVTLGSVKG
ncbi:carbohydrate ABC transporter permease [Mahella australiensis]|uniref:Carbohydrate ABC transporter membrane protein 2, CUT1 family n=1 Tax=Mahella australiensis (strain DSM 15567 / CIP 107919 / 50-1 BON) TaxID=697281 RepID=F3ZWI3_MAHA5|nr:carbohydrate ABC transporter permease [Mahella australiensis]AEE95418.1 carbohydrate ABC transporter membrane protein 2, CUT1 family [Mahella australiensis 50-1 BON]